MKKIILARLALAFMALVFMTPVAPIAGAIAAGVVLAFPSFRLQRGRLCAGYQVTDEELMKAIKDTEKAVGRFTDALDSKADKVEVMRIMQQLEEMVEDVQLSKGSGGGRVSRKLVDKRDLKDFIGRAFNDEGRKTRTEDVALKINSSLVFKAAETMTSEAFYQGSPTTQAEVVSSFFRDPTFYQLRRKKNTALDHIPIERVDSPFLFYVEKILIAGDDASQETTGAAEWVTSAQQKPGRSFRVRTTKAEAKKVAIFATAADSLLRDVASLENWIREDLIDEVKEAFNDALLNNDPTIDPNAPLGIKKYATPFQVTNAFNQTVSAPNLIDVLIASAASMIEAREQPARFLISADNWYALHVMKDNDQRYLNNDKIYVDSLGNLYIAGVGVFPVDSEDIDSDHYMLLGADLGFKVKVYQDLILERGLNGEDFRHDRTSFRAYQQVISYIPEHRRKSVQYDTIANVMAAIGTTSGS